MNYYEHHLGDYMRDTAHLTMLEDCAYRRLLDAYYARERPLPAELAECCKLTRATTKPERDAVAYVLREFFELADDGYHQGRADAEIERFRAKRKKAADSANARWNGCERNADAMRTHSERMSNASSSHDERNALQSPVSNLQTPEDQNPPTPRDRGASGRAGRTKAPDFDPASVPGLDAQAWARWVDYRKQISKPLKPVSVPAAAKALAAFGSNQVAVVEQSVQYGWTGLFELRSAAVTPIGVRVRSKTAAELEDEEARHAIR